MASETEVKDFTIDTGDFITVFFDKLYEGKTRVSNAAITDFKWAAIIKNDATAADSTASVSINSDSDPSRFSVDVSGSYPTLTVYLVTSAETDTMGAGIFHYEVWLYNAVSSNRQAFLEGQVSVTDSTKLDLFTP